MKEFILSYVRKISVEQLVEYILNDTVTFDELRATGNFPHETQTAVKAILDEKDKVRLEKEREREAREREAREEAEMKAFKEEQVWQTVKSKNTLNSYQYYQQQYPNGKYFDDADQNIYTLKEEITHKKRKILSDIRRNPDDYSKKRIQDYFDQGVITKDDLIDDQIITKRALETFLNPPHFENKIFDWTDLEPLKSDRTDIFFLGIPGSGKSCLLGGVLHYARKAGHLKIKGNIKGVKYANALIGTTKIGYVPPSTPVDGINYIEAVLRNDRNEEHPINIIEMSGEKMNNTYDYGTTTSAVDEGILIETIGAGEYLHNSNKKIIFFVIDYKETIDPKVTKSIADQAAILESALTLLERDGILKETYSVYIVLTKSDLLPGGADNLQEAKNFIDQEYSSFWNSVKTSGKDYEFGVKILTYSLGNFMLGTTFEFNPKYSENIYNAIIASTFTKKKSGGFLSRFK